MENLRLNQYKFKSSHNSYSKDFLLSKADLAALKDFLKEGYVGLELDIQKDRKGL
jgi:hypothetical protein